MCERSHIVLTHTTLTSADVNFMADTGMTPLIMAMNLEDGGPNPECIRTLVRLGADCSMKAGEGSRHEGMTPFEMLGSPDMEPEVWDENRIPVYAPHHKYRKFPHTAVEFLESQL